MTKILGLDLGVTSIGWAMIERLPIENKILGIGVRIIPLSTDESNEFTKGNAISKNRNRTLKRTARRNNYRYKLRKHSLRNVLIDHGMMPDNRLFLELRPLELYALRVKAIQEKITLPELGRVLFHMNQKRGYKGRPEVEESGNKAQQSAYLDAIADRNATIQENNWTVGQYLLNILNQSAHATIKSLIFPREAYIAEFNRIWEQQAVYHSVLTEELKQHIRDKIIFYQRPLKSQKHLVSACRFEPSHKVSPKSSPLFQLCKVWEEVNNISIKDKDGAPVLVTLEQKKQVVEYLHQHANISSSQLLKLLKLKPEGEYFPNYKIIKKGLDGNRTVVAIRKLLDKYGHAGENLLQFEIFDTLINEESGEVLDRVRIKGDFEHQPLYRLWHILYSLPEEQLVHVLKEKYGFTDALVEALASLDMKSGGFGNKSARAMRRILPFLVEGNIYSKACALAGYNHSDSQTKAESEARKLLDKLPEVKRNELRNPVVEKILNQLVNIVNSIIANPEYGRPDEIRIELARELKQNIDRRKDTYIRNNKMDAEHKKIAERLTEMGYKSITRNLIEKWKLYDELDGFCLYSGKKLVLAACLNGDRVDVDHIIPQSRLFDDSFLNKVLCDANENRLKGNMTAYDYMQSKGDEAFERYLAMVNALYANKKISYAKREKLLTPQKEIPQNFIDRQLRETQYITSYAREMLQKVCTHVTTTSGAVTDYLRHIWGYDELLMRLNLERFAAIGLVEEHFKADRNKHIKRINGWSKRDDHRHHGLDALVIAATKQKYVQQLNNLNQIIVAGLKKIDIGAERPFEPQEVENCLSRVLISFKSGRKLASKKRNPANGQVSLTPRSYLHMETVYGQIRKYQRVQLNTRFEDWESIVDSDEKSAVIARLSEFNFDPKKAFKNLEENPIVSENRPGKNINSVTIFIDRYVERVTLNDQFKAADVQSIVDVKVRAIVEKRLAQFNHNPKEAFRDLSANPIWFDESKRVPITSVRLYVNYDNLRALHTDENGKPKDFVIERNNHHVAIYENEKGERFENIVSFWTALERKAQGLPVFAAVDEMGNNLVLTLQINDMVVIGLNPKEVDFLDPAQFSLISKHLYRVQKLASKDYYFRHHLETKLEDNNITSELKRFLRLRTLTSDLPIKVKVSNLGKIVTVYSVR
ncbi:MAG TPA: type II CRISPR RNA-guided endonuclease Cas9 [Chitinophagales bacterium]|nr:type II CRISPR RNA-guided endonuclease Cas9 [Chitinophagales bacterium]